MDQNTSDTNENSNVSLNGEVYYQDIAECQAEFICHFNKDYNLTFVNGAFCDYFHLKRKDKRDQGFLDVIHEEDRDYFQALLSSLDRDNPVATVDSRVNLPNRNMRWQQWAIWAIFDDRGIIVEYQSAGRDITEQKLLEKRLRESKTNYEKLANNANDAIAIITGKDGRHVFVNKRMEEISGYTKSNLLKLSFREVIHPDDIDRINQRYVERIAGKKIADRIETKLVDKQGYTVPVEITDSLTDWNGQPAVLVIIRDIAMCTRSEADLRDSENNFRAMAQSARDGILLVAGEGVNVYANKGFAQISGYTVSELLKIGIKELVPADEFKKIAKRYFNRIAGKKTPSRYETNLVRKDGKIVPVEVSASKTVWQNQTAVQGIYRDISERKKREEEQKKVHDALACMIDERNSELVTVAEELELKHKELSLRRSELEKVNQELLDTNKALTALARNIDREREDAEKKIAKLVRSRMLPLLEDFQKIPSLKKRRAEIDELMLSLHELTPGYRKGTDIILSLSTTERRIAMMIKNGLTSPNIANVLHISLDTVKSHRRNIRKKLKLNNSRINLASYLDAKM